MVASKGRHASSLQVSFHDVMMTTHGFVNVIGCCM
jgi:hypothetical protein